MAASSAYCIQEIDALHLQRFINKTRLGTRTQLLATGCNCRLPNAPHRFFEFPFCRAIGYHYINPLSGYRGA
jgi:hypothetical protein